MALTKVSRGLLSTGIVDNSNATAITINADESVTFSGTLNGISTTKSASGNRWGVLPEVESNGVMEVGRYIDFHSTDGDTSDYGARLDFNGTDIVSTNAFQMSSGIYLGGTAAANKISDYETGVWTPAFSAAAQTMFPISWSTIANFTYTKIGRVVHLTGYLAGGSQLPSSGTLVISGLPFPGNASYNMSQLWFHAATDVDAGGFIGGNQSTLNVRTVNGNINELSELSCSMTYITNA
jgi:hypothetical protein